MAVLNRRQWKGGFGADAWAAPTADVRGSARTVRLPLSGWSCQVRGRRPGGGREEVSVYAGKDLTVVMRYA
jgi:hypothetical protein